MTDVLALMLPIFAMIAIGSLFVSCGWFPADGLPVLSRFVMNACIPVLLFPPLANGKLLAEFSWLNSILSAGASLVVVVLLWSFFRFSLNEPKPQSIILAMGGAAANAIFLGFPIASAFVPDRATDAFAWIVFA